MALGAAAALELDRRDREERWRTDPWAWVTDRVNLLDPLAQGSQVAPFPDFPYLKAVFEEIHEHNAIILWKSRRMIGSWSALVYAVWVASLFKNQRIFVVSRKEGENDGEGSRELIWRASWIAANLRGGPAKFIAGKLRLEFTETGSSISGISSEPNAMRGVSANLVIGDEMGFWTAPRDSFAALKPTLEARGKFIGISSSAEGFFKELIQDAVDVGEPSNTEGIVAVPGSGVKINLTNRVYDDDEYTSGATSNPLHVSDRNIPGFAAWTNKRNRFRILAIHYTADPRKRSAQWKLRESEGVPLSIWLREYEMQWSIQSGLPVYVHDWRPQVMLQEGIKTERTRPILCSLDFGYHNPALLVGQMRFGLQLCALRAFQGRQLRFEDFMASALSQLKSWFPQRDPTNPNDVLWCCDAAGDAEHSTGAPEVKILRRQFNIKPKFKKMRIPPTIDIVRGYMARTHRGEPCFLVDNNPSMHLVLDALNGGYAYPEGEVNEETVPDKDNIHDHLMDTLRYMAVNFGTPISRGDRAKLSQISRSDMFEAVTY